MKDSWPVNLEWTDAWNKVPLLSVLFMNTESLGCLMVFCASASFANGVCESSCASSYMCSVWDSWFCFCWCDYPDLPLLPVGFLEDVNFAIQENLFKCIKSEVFMNLCT